MDEKTTVREVLAGDQDAYRSLIERYERGLFNHIDTMVRDADLAEDICQEAFIKAYRSLKRYDERYAFSTWLYRIGHNLALTAIKKQRPMPLDELPEVAGHHDLRAEQERRSDQDAVRQAVAQLPTNYRTVVSLYYWQDMSYDEIARIMDIPEGTVKTWLHRAKRSLKENLDGQI